MLDLRGKFKMFTVALLLILWVNQIVARDYCFATENEPYLYMATKTAYHFVPGKTRFQSVPNCRPVRVWMFATHGTRCPSPDEITDMLDLTGLKNMIVGNHETRGDGHLCDRDLENLKRWQPDAYLARERAQVLTPQGVEDMRLLARRLQSNFPGLLQPNGSVTPEDYKFKGTEARDSMVSFMEGLLGSRTAVPIEHETANDTVLSGYQTCDAWKRMENGSIEELDKFEGGPEFQNLLKNVSRRLGFLYDLEKDTILTMYDMCRYEKAWTVTKLSPWCAVFSKEELRVLEYREDLEQYYKAGYGNEINAQLGCVILQDMMNHFKDLERDTDTAQPRGVFYFGDITGLQNLLTALGINKDETRLTASNYNEMGKRHWRTSFIASFAANLVVTFYKCEDSGRPNKVMFYLAEKPVLFEGCDVGLCDWEYLKSRFGPVVTHCNRDVCLNGSGVASSLVPNIALTLFTYLSLALFRH